MKKVIIYCQHVLGMGHFVRTMEIARGLKNFDVYIFNGGEIIPGFEIPENINLINLPPIKSDSEFTDIQADNETKENRKKLILESFDSIKPDILITELFPFGRLKFEYELIPLLDKAKKVDIKIICSIRDILVVKREQAAFEQYACDITNKYYDLLLIHSDPEFQRIEETFPSANKIRCPIQYTGFVTQQREIIILVSIGGGRIGAELIDRTIEASVSLLHDIPHKLKIFTGPYYEKFDDLQMRTADFTHIEVLRYTTDFIQEMKSADLSISMAGYNTCMNIITTGTRAILYPFTGNNNREQTIRADKFNQLGIADIIYSHDLSTDNLSKKIKEALKTDLNIDGVRRTYEALENL